MFEFTEMHAWLLGTAILFTFVGRWMVASTFVKSTSAIIEATIDRLIADGYIKARLDKNGEIELVKHNEE